MNKEWSEMNKTMQLQIKKKDTFSIGIDTLLTLREELMKQILQFKTELSFDDFSAMPYMNAKAMGIDKLLVTCDVRNEASEKTILANSGVFEKTIDVDGCKMKRYWIAV